MNENNPCRGCPDRISHTNECSIRQGQGVPCNCGLTDPAGKKWKCGDCESRRFHLSSCSVFNEPAHPAGPCDCGLTVSQPPA